MHISYQPLWDTLKERGMRKEDLRLSGKRTKGGQRMDAAA